MATRELTRAAIEAKRIRSVYKARGWTSKDVSVRASNYSMGSSIDIEILSPRVHLAEAKRIAYAFEEVRHDDATGEVLGGGNRFISVKQSSECLAELAAPYLEAFRAALAQADILSGPSIEGLDQTAIMLEDKWRARLYVGDELIFFDHDKDSTIVSACGRMAELLKGEYQSPVHTK